MDYTYVATVLVRGDGAILVQHRDNKPSIPEPDKWGICGGRRESEDPTDAFAASRELLEETGYEVNPEELIPFAEDEFNAGGDHITRKFYWAPYDGKQDIKCFEGQEIRFARLSELPALDFCEDYHRDYLRQASEAFCIQLFEGNKQAIK